LGFGLNLNHEEIIQNWWFEISQFWGKFVDKNLVETGFFSRRSEQKSLKFGRNQVLEMNQIW